MRRACAAVIASLRHQTATWELLILDDGSTDETVDVVSALIAAEPAVVLLTGSGSGLAAGRNVVAGAARGKVVLFADDDVIVPLDWAQELAAPVVVGTADAVAGTLHVAEHLRARCPQTWLLSALGESDLHGPATLVGASFACSVDTLRSTPFDEHLGPGRLGFWDDDRFAEDLRRGGRTIVSAGGRPAVHDPDPRRLHRPELRARALADGRSRAHMLATGFWSGWLPLARSARVAWVDHGGMRRPDGSNVGGDLCSHLRPRLLPRPPRCDPPTVSRDQAGPRLQPVVARRPIRFLTGEEGTLATALGVNGQAGSSHDERWVTARPTCRGPGRP